MKDLFANLSCPTGLQQQDQIGLGHGSGGQLSHDLLHQLIFPCFDNSVLAQENDSAELSIGGLRMAFTTDSFVVKPLFFPGGDIGKLAVCGTVNDLAMSGARPLYLSCSLIIEEGLAMNTLKSILESMSQSAQQAGVQLVTGDTKVVEKGLCDGLYINTAGIGIVEHKLRINAQSITTGDMIILSGDIGRHGMAVMAQREGLEFDNPLASDCAALAEPVLALLAAGVEIHCLRDLTRGGLATALVELAESSERSFRINEADIPVSDAVVGACEMLGLDPAYVANEGRFVLFVPQEQAGMALKVLEQHDNSKKSCVIGQVTEESRSELILCTVLGNERLLRRLPGEQLPRIC